MLPAMILAAGLGTRLRPLTDFLPKPLVPVGDRSVLAHAVEGLRRASVGRLAVNAFHLPAAVEDAAGRLEVEVSTEHELLGTAGGVAHAKGLLGPGSVVIWNGDVVADVAIEALVRAHEALAPEATLVVMPRPGREGNVGLDDEGRVVRLRQDSVGPEVRSADFACVQVLGGDLRATLPGRGCLVADVYIPALRRGATLRAIEHAGAWHDIGSLAAYLEANIAWLRARATRTWVGPGAGVAPTVTLEEAVVGAGASVTGSGHVARSVVWPGAHARASLEHAIVLADRVVDARPA